MISLVCVEPGNFDYVDNVDPEKEQGFAIVKIERIGICGTDLHAFEGTQPFFTYPRILGHELSAKVVSSEHFDKGDTVSIIPYFHCNRCYPCTIGKTNCCTNLKVAGVHVDGGFAEYYKVPETALIGVGDLSHDEVALIEPFAIGAHGISRASIKEGEDVLIVGAGPIGITLIAFAKLAGARVTVLDVNDFRLEFCRNTLHVDHAVNAKDENLAQQLRDITNGIFFPVVIDATGSVAAINNAFQYMSHAARYVLVGLQKDNVQFSHPEFHKREGTLMSSRNATRADFELVIKNITSKKINPLSLITHRIAFNDVKNEFATLIDPRNNVMKAVVHV